MYIFVFTSAVIYICCCGGGSFFFLARSTTPMCNQWFTERRRIAIVSNHDPS